MENNTVIRLNVILSKYEEEMKSLSEKVNEHEIGYMNGYHKGEIHQLELVIRDLKHVITTMEESNE